MVGGYSPAKAWPNSDTLINLHEREIARAVLRHTHLYQFFDFAVSESLGKIRSGWQQILLTEIERSWLGLQPGDIDVVIIPYRDGRLHMDKVAAIEVRRLAAKLGKLGKNTEQYGITQATELLRDDFPYVGVLHIIVPEAEPASEQQELMRALCTGCEDRVEQIGSHFAHVTSLLAAERNVHRLMRQQRSEPIGINAVGIQRGSPDSDCGSQLHYDFSL